MTPFEIVEPAPTDIESAIAYYLSHDSDLAIELQTAIERAIGEVVARPRWFGFYPGTRHRMIKVGKFSYFLLYIYRSGLVSFRAMPHVKQDSTYWRAYRRRT